MVHKIIDFLINNGVNFGSHLVPQGRLQPWVSMSGMTLRLLLAFMACLIAANREYICKRRRVRNMPKIQD